MPKPTCNMSCIETEVGISSLHLEGPVLSPPQSHAAWNVWLCVYADKPDKKTAISQQLQDSPTGQVLIIKRIQVDIASQLS
jgi:hypothetical protein